MLNSTDVVSKETLQAIVNNDIKKLGSLLKDKECANIKDRVGSTGLMWAVMRGSVESVMLFIEHGADVNAFQDDNGFTALHYAATLNDHEKALVLINAGAIVDSQDTNGNTALSRGVFNVKNGDGKLIKLLLSKGADKNLKNKSGVSPLDLAKSIDNYNILPFLK